MTSSDELGHPEDAGLLSPVRAGTTVEVVTGDRALLQALLDAESALTRAQAGLGLAPRSAAEAVEQHHGDEAEQEQTSDDHARLGDG
ncbi:hypothetical protein ACWD4L_20220, partial [Streptomyces sp. NPDC002596]